MVSGGKGGHGYLRGEVEEGTSMKLK